MGALRAALLVLALVFSGCGEPGEHLVLWHSYRGDEEISLNELARRYEREHPGITIELLAIPFDAYGAKLSAAIPHAHGPDLFIEAHERLGSYLKEKLVAPVGDAFPEEDVAKFDATSVEAITVAGARYAVPLANKCLALYVNDKLVTGTPATLEEILSLRQTLPPDVFPLAYDTSSAFFHAPFLHAFGGDMLDRSDGFAFTGDRAAASVDFVHELVATHLVPEEPNDALVASLFKSGHAAAVINGPWFQADLKDSLSYRIIPLPRIAATGEKMRPYMTVEGVFVTPTGATKNT